MNEREKDIPFVKEMIVDYLKRNKYTGLCGDGCGCELQDICPCDYDNNIGSCQAGYKWNCKNCEESGNCETQSEYEINCQDGFCIRTFPQVV